MSVPKKRRTSSSAGRRRSHHALKNIATSTCQKCGQAIRPHNACSFCGEYKGRQAIEVKAKSKKK